MRTGLGTAATMLLLAAGCGGSAVEPRIAQGECADVFGASVCTWASFDAQGGLIEFGATVPLAAVEGAPEDHEMAWPPVAAAAIGMPAELTAATGVDHLTVYWEPHGHPPGAYLTPHFDFHLYSVSPAAREAMDCTDTTKPATLPAGYTLVDLEVPELGTLVGLCVPQMGMHALVASELDTDEPFDGTIVLGYYGAVPMFFEPMIATHHLQRRQSFELPMPTVTGLPDGVRYPQRFRAEYDPSSDAYRFIFSGA